MLGVGRNGIFFTCVMEGVGDGERSPWVPWDSLGRT